MQAEPNYLNALNVGCVFLECTVNCPKGPVSVLLTRQSDTGQSWSAWAAMTEPHRPGLDSTGGSTQEQGAGVAGFLVRALFWVGRGCLLAKSSHSRERALVPSSP